MSEQHPQNANKNIADHQTTIRPRRPTARQHWPKEPQTVFPAAWYEYATRRIEGSSKKKKKKRETKCDHSCSMQPTCRSKTGSITRRIGRDQEEKKKYEDSQLMVARQDFGNSGRIADEQSIQCVRWV